jgi:hypothetical protein
VQWLLFLPLLFNPSFIEGKAKACGESVMGLYYFTKQENKME